MKHKLVLLAIGTCGVMSLATTPALAADPAAISCGVLDDSICSSAQNQDVKSSGIFGVLRLALTILTGGVGVAAVAVFVYAGILYSSAGGDSARVSQAKKLITDATIGLILYAAIFFALNWLIPGGVLGK